MTPAAVALNGKGFSGTRQPAGRGTRRYHAERGAGNPTREVDQDQARKRSGALPLAVLSARVAFSWEAAVANARRAEKAARCLAKNAFLPEEGGRRPPMRSGASSWPIPILAIGRGKRPISVEAGGERWKTERPVASAKPALALPAPDVRRRGQTNSSGGLSKGRYGRRGLAGIAQAQGAKASEARTEHQKEKSKPRGKAAQSFGPPSC